MPRRRYCLSCDELKPAREYECKACGAKTEPWPEDEPAPEAEQ